MTLEAITVIKEKRMQVFIPDSNSCACKSLFKNKISTFDFANPNQLKLEEGLVVKMLISPKKSILTSFVFFLLPLILLGTTFIMTQSISQIPWLPALLSLASLPLSLLLSILYSRMTGIKFQPVLLEILSKTTEECAGCHDCGKCPSINLKS